MIGAPLERGWEAWSFEYQAAIGRLILASTLLEYALAFAVHHLGGSGNEADQDTRLTAYAKEASDPLSANGKRIRSLASPVLGAAVADRLSAELIDLAEKRNIIVHGNHGPEDGTWFITKFPRVRDAIWDRRMPSLPGTISTIDELTNTAGRLVVEVSELGAKISGLRV